jgi:glycosyltransferase involved in cell wall biosynthesis
MRIVIDCRWIDASGVGVYLQGCLPFFLDCRRGIHTLCTLSRASLQGGVVNSDNTFLLLGNAARLAPFFQGRINAEILDCQIKSFSLRELFFFPGHLLKKINSCGLYYSPYFNIPGFIRIPIFTTIHDIIFPDRPELCSPLGLAARMWFYRRAFKRSKKIFTVSEFSKSRIEHYSRHKTPVIVTYSAIRPSFLKTSFLKTSFLETRKTKKKNSILFIGNIKKHKGLDHLLEAFTRASSEGLPYQLIIIGNKDNFRTGDKQILRRIDSLGPDKVRFTGFISDEELAEYLSTAALLVQPSLYEGFGLPPIEAMVHGTMVLISDIPVFKEIYDCFPVIFFQAGNTEDLKNKMMEILCDKNKIQYVPVLPDKLLYKYTFEKTGAIILRELGLS